MIRRFIRDEEAATAIEYALIAGLIAAVLVTVLTALGLKIEDVFETISAALPGS